MEQNRSLDTIEATDTVIMFNLGGCFASLNQRDWSQTAWKSHNFGRYGEIGAQLHKQLPEPTQLVNVHSTLLFYISTGLGKESKM